MSKAILELNTGIPLKDGDLLVFSNGKLIPITRAQLFKRTNIQLQYLEDYIKSVEKRADRLELEMKRDRGEIQ